MEVRLEELKGALCTYQIHLLLLKQASQWMHFFLTNNPQDLVNEVAGEKISAYRGTVKLLLGLLMQQKPVIPFTIVVSLSFILVVNKRSYLFHGAGYEQESAHVVPIS